MTGRAVFVTGATGTVGASVVQRLLERGEPVLAAVRGTDFPALPDGAQARPFDFDCSPAALDGALDGADRLFLMRPPPIADVQRYLFPLIDAAMRRGIRQIVFLSLQGVQFNRQIPHHAVEAYLHQVDAPFTLLRPNFFMQNLSTAYADRIRNSNEIFVPAGRSYTAFVDARDIGRVAAEVLTAVDSPEPRPRRWQSSSTTSAPCGGSSVRVGEGSGLTHSTCAERLLPPIDRRF